MIKRTFIAAAAILSSAAAMAAVATIPYKGTVSAASMHSGGGDQSTNVSVVFGCPDGIFGPVDLCIDAVTTVYDKVVPMTMEAQVSPRLSVHARTIVMRYVFNASYADGAASSHLVNLKRPDDGVWGITVNPGKPMLVTCISRNGGDTWSDCRTISQ